jgi:anthranilate synthase component 1
MVKTHPALEEFKTIAREKLKNLNNKVIVPVWCELVLDLESPVALFYKVCKDEDYSFLLESTDGGEQFGRYSILGCKPLYIIKAEDNIVKIFNMLTGEVIQAGSDPYEALKNFLSEYSLVDEGKPYFSGGAVGYFSYDSVRHIEPVLNDLFTTIEHCVSFPEAYFMIADTTIVFDHVKHRIYLINNVFVDETRDLEIIYKNAIEKINDIIRKIEQPLSAPVLKLNDTPRETTIKSNISKEKWNSIINKTIEYIRAGDIFQAVLSQRFEIEKPDIDNFIIYRTLRSLNPSPYMYYLHFKDFQIIGSSPEMLVKCTPDGTVNTHPIAGTRHRGFSLEEDDLLAQDLLGDPKERAEHIMLVDLSRNDLGRVCEYGSVKMARLMEIEKYSHVMHIVSDVTGKLKKDISIIDLLRACFPAGTLSGAPKIKAMEIIYELEQSARGPYGGCVGYIGFNNELNTAITIRTMLIKDNKLFVQAGAGIVADSVAENEYQECVNKAKALIQTINLLSP